MGMEEAGKVEEEEMGIRTKNSWMPGGESILEPDDVSNFVRQVTDEGL